MEQASSWQGAAVRRPDTWSLLRSWLGDHTERSFKERVLQPVHDRAAERLGDRTEAWDVTLEAFERLLSDLGQRALPALTGGPGHQRQQLLTRLVRDAEVDGEPLLFAFLRRRLARDVEDLADELLRARAEGPHRIPAARARRELEALAFDVDPLGEAERHEAVDRVRDALHGLTGKLREAQELALDGLSQRQIASRLHLSRGAVRWRLEQASQLLSERLGDAYGMG